MKHCCDEMNEFLDDERIPITYTPKFREYHLPLVGSDALQQVCYCPWCGSKLPEPLRYLWFETLEKMIGEKIYDIAWDLNRVNEIPEKFKNDSWWLELNV